MVSVTALSYIIEIVMLLPLSGSHCLGNANDQNFLIHNDGNLLIPVIHTNS
jgi:hypothetical protein